LRFRNLSGLALPKGLWRELAIIVGVGSTLRRAREDDLGMYAGYALRVTVNPARERKEGNSLAGSYTYGHIALYPCSRCNVAFLTEVYLHELVHALVDDCRSREVNDHWYACAVADSFATQAFARLGGEVAQHSVMRECQGYSLSVDTALSRVARLTGLVERLYGEVPTAHSRITPISAAGKDGRFR